MTGFEPEYLSNFLTAVITLTLEITLTLNEMDKIYLLISGIVKQANAFNSTS